MDVGYMRNRINEYYNGKWLSLRTMPDNQIIAIYNQMRNSGKFDKKKSAFEERRHHKESLPVQISIFETDEYLRSICK